MNKLFPANARQALNYITLLFGWTLATMGTFYPAKSVFDVFGILFGTASFFIGAAIVDRSMVKITPHYQRPQLIQDVYDRFKK